MSASRTGRCRTPLGSLAYSEWDGAGPPLVLLHGLLLNRAMHAPLAEALARHGRHVVTVDLLGHGASDSPEPTERYSVAAFAEQIVGLIDRLGAGRAVVGGTSLGANVSLEVAARAPERVAGLVIEMPVLDNALIACAVAFTPLCIVCSAAPVLWRVATAPARLLPRRLAGSGYLGVALDSLRQDPEVASRVLRGLLFGRTAPTHRDRIRIQAPALVIGHPRDPIHPLSDADMLARELRAARLVRASSMVELRLRPARLTAEIAAFLDGIGTESGNGTASGAASRPGTRRPTRARLATGPQTRRTA